jgi:chromosome segregation ATPase
MTANKKLDCFEKKILDEKVSTLQDQNKQLVDQVGELKNRNAQLDALYQKDTKALQQQVKKLSDVIELEFVTRIDELQALNEQLESQDAEHKDMIKQLKTQLKEEVQQNYQSWKVERSNPFVQPVGSPARGKITGGDGTNNVPDIQQRSVAEMFALLDSKDDHIELLTQDLKAERSKLEQTLKTNGAFEMQVKLLENELNQLIHENQELKQKLETQKIKLSQHTEISKRNEDLVQRADKLSIELMDLQHKHEGLTQASQD